MPIQVTPKAVMRPKAQRREQGEHNGDDAGQRQVGDVHIVGLQGEIGNRDAHRIGNGGDRKINLGGQNHIGEPHRDDRR